MTPDPAIERAAIALFERLLDIDDDARTAWVDRETEGNPALRARLVAMLVADRRAAFRTGGASAELDEEEAPEHIGAYRIAERIGRGGMGSVYRGERATGDFAHVAAIKVIKPGLLSETLIDRFRRERQTLAALSHPNIAQLYDGGETEGGSPYIVMEYVDGQPLLNYAESAGLSRDQRLALFGDICAAVAFAHSHLIVHRDLTPSNVLVTAQGRVKLIDFGIAKPADPASPEPLTPAPSIGSLSLTPGYAAPERMTSAEVTTAADIYSLGRLLSRLLGAEPGGELRAIIAKATRPLPADRYSTVDMLAADVDAFRNGMPVSAMEQRRSYILRTFIARHRTAVVSIAGAFIVLIGALTLITIAYSQAKTARDAEAARFTQLRSLAHYLLFDLNDRLERVVGNTQARANLADEAQRYLTFLARSPRADASVRLEAAEGLIKLARIQGVPNEPNLGQSERAKSNLDIAERLLTALGDMAGAKPALAEARALRSLILLHSDAKPEAATKALNSALASFPASPASADDAAWFRIRRTLRKAQLEHADLGDRIATIPAIANAMDADIQAWPHAKQTSFEADLDRAYAAYYRAFAASMGEDPKPSVPMFLDAERRFAALSRRLPDDPVVLYMSAYNRFMGFAAASQVGQEEISSRMIREARADVDQLLRLEANDNSIYALSANIKEALAQDLRDRDHFAEAVALQQDVVAGRRDSIARKPSARATGNLAFSSAILGVIARDADDRALACSSWKEAEQLMSDLDRRKVLLPFMGGFVPGLRANVKKCEAGLPISSFGPLR